MPKRKDIEKIMIIGSGPIVIGQACEFDYSGSQACKILREEGYAVILVNSNPATIMTDPGMADATYIEPLEVETLEAIIKKEKPGAILPTLGGQTALNCAVKLEEAGILASAGTELIGANTETIKKAEDRQKFKDAMKKAGIPLPDSGKAYTMEEAEAAAEEIGFPLVVRPSFTLGGSGGGIAFNREEFRDVARWGLDSSMISEILIEESVLGWKEFELELMRDKNDTAVVVCSIENLDPMGVHTGDSITAAPAQTLSDPEYQKMRDYSLRCIREIGVETGGANVQFAVNPEDGRMVIIEMNPRVSRSSALASKATGFPIAKIAAKLAVGYTLDEIPNDITRETPSCFEPALDYCVVKIPRFNFEKFPSAEKNLTITMKSVGETMAIGRTFKEALQKAIRSLETGASGFASGDDFSANRLRTPGPERIFHIAEAFRRGMPGEEIYGLTSVDPWFLSNIKEIVDLERELSNLTPLAEKKTGELLKKAKTFGFSDKFLSKLLKKSELQIRNMRKALGIIPKFKSVDTCAGEFEAYTPYFYSSHEE